MRSLLRRPWETLFPAPWILGILLLVIVGAWRAYIILGPPHGAPTWMVSYFLALALIPLLLFRRPGRARVGITKPRQYSWLLRGTLLGGLAAVVAGVAGAVLYGTSADNWFVTVREATVTDPRLAALPPGVLFAALAGPAAIFSPLGEELFFRGALHDLLEDRFGRAPADWATAVAFGAIHLLHHGVSFGSTGLDVRVVSGALWLVLIIAVSLLLTWCRRASGSIWTAVSAHAGFNVTMMAFVVRLPA